MGNWKECYEYLTDIKIWKELDYGDYGTALENLKTNVKESTILFYFQLLLNVTSLLIENVLDASP